MLLAKRQHEERESVSSLFLCVKRKNLKGKLNFAATNSPIQLLPLRVHLWLPWSLHLHYLNFRHIVYVYTSSIRRIFYVLFSLYPISSPLPPSLFQNFFPILYGIFLEFFLKFFSFYIVYMQYIPGNFFWNFSRIFFYIYYICRGFFQNFF